MRPSSPRAGRALPGAAEAIAALRVAGIKVCLTTGFSAATRDAVLDAVGWRDTIDLALTPEESAGGRGRPHPDMILTAVLRLGVTDVRAVAVAGDTANDLWAGWHAGASVVAGVLTGAHDRATLARRRTPISSTRSRPSRPSWSRPTSAERGRDVVRGPRSQVSRNRARRSRPPGRPTSRRRSSARSPESPPHHPYLAPITSPAPRRDVPEVTAPSADRRASAHRCAPPRPARRAGCGTSRSWARYRRSARPPSPRTPNQISMSCGRPLRSAPGDEAAHVVLGVAGEIGSYVVHGGPCSSPCPASSPPARSSSGWRPTCSPGGATRSPAASACGPRPAASGHRPSVTTSRSFGSRARRSCASRAATRPPPDSTARPSPSSPPSPTLTSPRLRAGADTPPLGDPGAALALDPAAVEVFASWYDLGWRALDAVVRAGAASEAPVGRPTVA